MLRFLFGGSRPTAAAGPGLQPELRNSHSAEFVSCHRWDQPQVWGIFFLFPLFNQEAIFLGTSQFWVNASICGWHALRFHISINCWEKSIKMKRVCFSTFAPAAWWIESVAKLRPIRGQQFLLARWNFRLFFFMRFLVFGSSTVAKTASACSKANASNLRTNPIWNQVALMCGRLFFLTCKTLNSLSILKGRWDKTHINARTRGNGGLSRETCYTRYKNSHKPGQVPQTATNAEKKQR